MLNDSGTDMTEFEQINAGGLAKAWKWYQTKGTFEKLAPEGVLPGCCYEIPNRANYPEFARVYHCLEGVEL